MSPFASPLKRRILLRLLIAAGLLSALLLAAFLAAYRGQLENERSRASAGFNLLLQAALENAMLKRDVPGLREIVERLGTQPGIRTVMILNPAGEVRFASAPDLLGLHRPELVPGAGARGPATAFLHREDGAEVLRSVNPVRNKAACRECHGDAAAHPVNGILVVDYDAGEIRQHAWGSAAAFTGAGLLVLLILTLVLWRSLNRQVLQPVAALARASAELEAGRLDRRVAATGDDELADLGRRFDRMAERLQDQLARVRAHEAYLQAILDSLPDGVRVIRVADGRIAMANGAFARQVGLPLDKVVGETCHRASHGRDAPCVATLVTCPLQALHQVGDTLKCTHRHQKADGGTFPVEVHAAMVELEAEGRRERYVVESVRDLSQAARVSHEQRLSELGLLAAGIAHEIHNPLASVRLGVQGLARDIRTDRCTPGEIGNYLDLIDNEIDKCIEVTRRLLLLSRTPEEAPQVVDLATALDDAVRLLDYDARIRGITQDLALPPVAVRVLADEGELRMVFLNLFQNAHHAMPGGGTLTVTVAAHAAEAAITVADTGVGIAEDVLPHIFDPFYSRRADGVAGTGLGLTIVRNIVQRYGGNIGVESSPGRGSRFLLRLPLAEAAVGAAP
ncbi:MAG: HAMP domain-containing protein [Rhodocyclaceae bacterium]|nr:HAMP domain-containing protein [Rhodocyclaceae bacterium]